MHKVAKDMHEMTVSSDFKKRFSQAPYILQPYYYSNQFFISLLNKLRKWMHDKAEPCIQKKNKAHGLLIIHALYHYVSNNFQISKC